MTEVQMEQFFVEEGLLEEDDEEVTAHQVLKLIQDAWSNEKLAPELLPHKQDYVEVMMEQVEQMEENVRQLSKTDLRSMIHRHELERIRYLMRSYLRTRLNKIECYALWLLRVNPAGVLSPQEETYLKEYITNTAHHLKTTLDHLPHPTSALNAKQLEEEPQLESHVFVRCGTDRRPVNLVISGDEEVSLTDNSQHIIPYSAIADMVRQCQVQLI